MPKKYEWIRAPLKKARHDVRPESFNPQIEQIKIGSYVSTEREWRPRWEILRPLLQPSMCGMQRKCEENGSPTLGFFKPKISRLLIESASPNWTQAQQETLSQTSMLYDLPATPLEKIPFDFKYEFRCSDPGCKGHAMRCTDWEIAEAYRQWRRQYGDDWERPFRQRFEDEMINRYDTHFFVGNLHQRPNVWIVVGLFYSPPQTTRDMFLQ